MTLHHKMLETLLLELYDNIIQLYRSTMVIITSSWQFPHVSRPTSLFLKKSLDTINLYDR